MFESIKRLYEKIEDKTIVKNAVMKSWITELQYEEITGEKAVNM